ncbi:Asp23/Gls24 family envelope stress response protein [Geodermatophilus chilensis]|uniref:Asp23/Gls24 family envelope stress response protein n=1 Tax=Geodermatophilus chilensis TaxID=2035835 RepID=UPI002FCD8A35
MSTAADVAVTGRDAETAVAAGPGPGDPGDRGDLTIADRVVERVAGYAVTQVQGASAAPRRVLGINVGDARPDDEASVRARVDGGTATVEATIAVEWPHPIPVVAERLRRRVRDDVARLTDVQVAHIDLDVVSLPLAASRPRRVQ